MSFSFADNKTGGRFMAAADAIAAGHLRKAAGILNEIAEELNVEAETTDGLMADEGDLEVQEPAKPSAMETVAQDLQSCSRGAHNFPDKADENGWRKCLSCGVVNVAPPDGGAVDMSHGALGDL